MALGTPCEEKRKGTCTCCKHSNPEGKKEKSKPVTCPRKKIIVKCKLEKTDNENRYFLVNGPVYLKKSVVDLKNSLLQHKECTLDNKCNLGKKFATVDNVNEKAKANKIKREDEVNEAIEEAVDKLIDEDVNGLIKKEANEKNSLLQHKEYTLDNKCNLEKKIATVDNVNEKAKANKIKRDVDKLIKDEVNDAIEEAVDKLIDEDVNGLIEKEVNEVIKEAANNLVGGGANGLIKKEVNGISNDKVNEAIDEAVDKLTEEDINKLIEKEVNEVIKEAANNLVEGHANELIKKKVNELIKGEGYEAIEEAVDQLIEEVTNELIEKVNEVIKEAANYLTEEDANELIEKEVKELIKDEGNELIEEEVNEVVEKAANYLTEKDANERIEKEVNELIKDEGNEVVDKPIGEDSNEPIEEEVNEVVKVAANYQTEKDANERIEKEVNELIKDEGNEVIEEAVDKLIGENSNVPIEEEVNEVVEAVANDLTESEKDELTGEEANKLIDGEVNQLERWRNSCKEGIFSIKDLLYVCETDPNSILEACRKSWSRYENVPPLETLVAADHKGEPISQITLTHGARFGDAKYHFLMVDANTSTSNISSCIHFNEEYADRDNNTNLAKVVKENPNWTNRGRRVSIVSEDITILKVDEELKRKKSSQPDIGPVQFPGRASILLPKHSEDLDRPEVKFDVKEIEKHHSTVSWSFTTPSDTITPGEIESAEKSEEAAEALAKAELHQFVEVKNQYTLLGDIIDEERRRSSHVTRVSIIGQKEKVEVIPERHMLSRFARCCGLLKIKDRKDTTRKSIMKKSNIRLVDGNMEDSDSSTSEVAVTGRGHSQGSTSSIKLRAVAARRQSQASTTSYKLRPVTVENPVFEKHRISKYLNNM